MSDQMMGIDVGGSGIKGGIVDLETARLTNDRIKLATPQPSTPEAVAETVAEVLEAAGWDGAVGCTIPGVVQHGIVRTAANIDRGWVDCDGRTLLSERLGREVTLVNDADAAGLAEIELGAGREHEARDGVVILLTFGTGIGSALLTGGRLVANTELGHLQMWGGSAEERASSNAKEAEDLSWKEWAARVEEYLRYVESLFWPDLFIFGGGVSRKHEKFLPRIETRAPIVPAELRNNAGIAGVALAAHRRFQP
jgi:polyphosphate glucokinase